MNNNNLNYPLFTKEKKKDIEVIKDNHNFNNNNYMILKNDNLTIPNYPNNDNFSNNIRNNYYQQQGILNNRYINKNMRNMTLSNDSRNNNFFNTKINIGIQKPKNRDSKNINIYNYYKMDNNNPILNNIKRNDNINSINNMGISNKNYYDKIINNKYNDYNDEYDINNNFNIYT